MNSSSLSIKKCRCSTSKYPRIVEFGEETIRNRLIIKPKKLSSSVDLYNFVYTYFEPRGLASLLAVTSDSLKLMRVLEGPPIDNTSVHLPSLEIISVSFNNKESIWYNVNNIMATQKTSKYHENKCVDPILDFQVINYAEVPSIISSILFRHYGTWTVPKAQPLYGVLESAQTVDVKVSFEHPASAYAIDPPIYVMPSSPGRFQLRLVDFARRCPGTDAFIQLGLIYDNEVCDTPIFHMDIRGVGETHGEASEQTDSVFTPTKFYKVEKKDLR